MTKAIITPENAAQAEAELAALRAAETRANIEAENARRAEARAAVQPVVDLIKAPKIDVEAVRSALPGLPFEEREMQGLCDTMLRLIDAARALGERRIADTELTPVPEA